MIPELLFLYGLYGMVYFENTGYLTSLPIRNLYFWRSQTVIHYMRESAGYIGFFLLVAVLISLPGLFAQADTDESAIDSVGNSQTVGVLDLSMAPLNNNGAGTYIRIVENTLVVESGPSRDHAAATLEEGETGSVINTYVVEPGDTISGIAERFAVSQDTIIWANDLRGSTIQIGQELVILPISGVLHTVTKGDTISGLAKKYSADAYDIESYNGLENNAILEIGSQVTIPYGSIPKPKVTVARTTRSGGGSSSYSGAWTNTRTVWVNGVKTTALRNTNGPNYDSYYTKPILGYPRSRGLHGNNSVDWAAPSGTPVQAAAGGTVNIAKYGGWNGGYGKYVVINHSNGTQTLYAHMSRVAVLPGQTVSNGQTIGYVGTTGNSTGNHLHFEVRGAQNPWR